MDIFTAETSVRRDMVEKWDLKCASAWYSNKPARDGSCHLLCIGHSLNTTLFAMTLKAGPVINQYIGHTKEVCLNDLKHWFVHKSPSVVKKTELTGFVRGLWLLFGLVLLGNMGRLDGIMDAEKHSKVLIQQSIPSGKYLTVNGFIFQRDKIQSTPWMR